MRIRDRHESRSRIAVVKRDNGKSSPEFVTVTNSVGLGQIGDLASVIK